jgi:hypothetical protein
LGINVSAATIQANKMSSYGSTLRDVRNNLNNFKANLNNGWQAEEMIFINKTIDSIISDINRLSQDMDSLGNDIIFTANEIRREEIARAEAAAREAAAREAAARSAQQGR